MPTLPSEDAPAPKPESHQQRQMAESFGIDAERYDRARPRYPDELVQRIVAASPGPDVLDIGCGTGIAARQFQAAGCAVLGVDPDPRMAEFARHSGVEVEVATFEEWDPAGRTFDAAIAAQSWHWVDPVAGAVKAARVLRPGGRLAIFAHVFAPPAEITDALATAFERVVSDSPFDLRAMQSGAAEAYEGMLATLADITAKTPGFTDDPQQWRFDWAQPYTRDEWLDQMPTTGVLTRLPADQLAPVLDAVGATIDRMGGGFTMHFTTVALVAARTDAA